MRSLNTGFEEMSALTTDFDFDVLGVTETWLSSTTPSEHYEIPGYTLLRADRAIGTGGGVALYIKCGIVFEQLHITCVDPGIEFISLILKVRGVKLCVAIVYRPPHGSYTCLGSLFQALFVDIAVQVDYAVCLGDVNIDLISNSSHDAKYLQRLLRFHNVVQHVTEPTRVTASSATLIDHIYTNKAMQLKRCGVIDASAVLDYKKKKITDHKLIYCELEVKKEKPTVKFVTYRDFSKFNTADAISMLQNVKWEAVLKMDDVGEINSFISSAIKDVYDKHAPQVTKRVSKRKAPWRNDEIIMLTKLKNKLRNRFLKTKQNCDWEEYKKVRNRLNGAIRRAKRHFFTDKLADCKDSRKFWRCLKQSDMVKKKCRNDLPKDLKVSEMNEYFARMGSFYDADTDLISLYNEEAHNKTKFKFRKISVPEVRAAINEITSRAVGIDEISIAMIKSVSPFAIEAITHLMNASLEKGDFPLSWKKSIIIPLPKKQNPSNLNELRPISVLPAMSKILEKLVIQQVTEFINTENLLPKLQSGFRKNHSTCTALLNMFADLFGARDAGRCSSIVMLDYSQAFDSISHTLLLAKLKHFGFNGNAIAWFRSYLEKRLQVTRVGTDVSPPLEKSRGVPQGSCLGPILFTLYTADLSSCVGHGNVHSYADDCQLHFSYAIESADQAFAGVNSDLARVSEWSRKHGLKLNAEKCMVLHIAPPTALQTMANRDMHVKLEGKNLMVSDSVKTLGVVLDSGLAFSDHITHVSQVALGRLRGLYRYRNILPEAAKLQLAQSLVLSVLCYCFPAYGNSITREEMSRLQKLQNSALRFVYGIRRRERISPFREAAGLLRMDAVCRLQTCSLIHRALVQQEPQYLVERLVPRGGMAVRETRHNALLHFPKVRLEVGRKGFSYFGPKLYNDLPLDLKQLGVLAFKAKLKQMSNRVHSS
jgi:hypothetical protein